MLALGLALGLGIAIVIILNNIANSMKTQTPVESGMIYSYDDENRLQAIVPVNNNVRLKPIR